MTQEQTMRRLLQGFVDDPPDSEYQEGFLAALAMFANEVMGFEWNDPLLVKAMAAFDGSTPTAHATVAKARPALTIINGGKPNDGG
jgi:hypothetical protein